MKPLILKLFFETFLISGLPFFLPFKNFHVHCIALQCIALQCIALDGIGPDWNGWRPSMAAPAHRPLYSALIWAVMASRDSTCSSRAASSSASAALAFAFSRSCACPAIERERVMHNMAHGGIRGRCSDPKAKLMEVGGGVPELCRGIGARNFWASAMSDIAFFFYYYDENTLTTDEKWSHPHKSCAPHNGKAFPTIKTIKFANSQMNFLVK